MENEYEDEFDDDFCECDEEYDDEDITQEHTLFDEEMGFWLG